MVRSDQNELTKSAISRWLRKRSTGTSAPEAIRSASIWGRFTRSKFQMNESTAVRPPGLYSPRRRVRSKARHVQSIRDFSSQTMSCARGKRRSNVARAKLPSLIQPSGACASANSARKAATSLTGPSPCHIASRQITGKPVRSPIRRAKMVLPLAPRPTTTIRLMTN
jgi:hypothetical protein